MAKKRTRKTTTSRKQSKSTRGKKPTVKDKLGTSSTGPEEVSFRVFPVDELLREEMATSREEKSLTIQKLIRASVEEHLQITVEQLHGMGLAHESSLRRPARWPLDSGVLAALRLASAQTTVSQQDLLIACLRKYCSK